MNFLATMLYALILAMTSLLHIAGAGQCFTDFGDDYGKCRLEGRFTVANYNECCSTPNATGYTESTSWIVFPEYYLFNRKNAVTSCSSCADYMSDDQGKKWCFTYRNSADSYCVQSTPISETLPASNEQDCCKWHNATGYADDPTWRWAKSYGRWVTKCDACDKDDLVGCYEQLSIVKSAFACTGAQTRMAESSTECCSRQNVKAYDMLDRYGNRMRRCYPCPINGNWSPWSVWSPCSTTCGDQGQKRRLRACNNPVRQFGGEYCVGSTEDIQSCYSNISCPTDGRQLSPSDDGSEVAMWSSWSSFSSCSVTCGNGSWTRQRVCLHSPNQAPSCEGPTRETLPCQGPSCENNSYRTKNAVVIELNWGPWTPCPVTCGVGIRKRYAPCTTPTNESSTEAEDLSTECAEMSFCELDPCPAARTHHISPSESDVIIAWTVATLATAVLIISFIVLICRKRLRNRMDWPKGFRKKDLDESSSSSKERKPRMPSDLPLPPVPSVPSAQAYCSMDILQKCYTQDGAKTSIDSASQPDDEGYEIPIIGTEVKSEQKDNVQSENLRNSNQTYYKNGTIAINHVYEQLEFGQHAGMLK